MFLVKQPLPWALAGGQMWNRAGQQKMCAARKGPIPLVILLPEVASANVTSTMQAALRVLWCTSCSQWLSRSPTVTVSLSTPCGMVWAHECATGGRALCLPGMQATACIGYRSERYKCCWRMVTTDDSDYSTRLVHHVSQCAASVYLAIKAGS